MKLFSRLLMLITLPLLLFAISGKVEAATLNTRALWISSVYNLDYPSRPGLSADRLRAEADDIIAYAVKIHATDLFLQVRSCGDALYASDIFPWSQYLSGQAGVAPKDSFDPLAYFVQQGHAQGIRIHAWVNPYILTRQKADTREDAFALLPANHPAQNISDAVVYHTNGQLYLDLGHPDARALILSGIAEILEKYPVDGIHFDDYFYPGQDFADAATYAAFGNGLSLESFRRQSVNTLIAEAYATVHQTTENAVFGVSPSGIWANETHNALGSATQGRESYYELYADSRKWVQDGIVDYLIPQIYWHMGHESADFTTLANWWNEVAAGTGVELYLGLGAYRMDEANRNPAWNGTDEILRQLKLCDQLANISGVSLYRYKSCQSNANLTEVLEKNFADAQKKLESALLQDPLAVLKEQVRIKKLNLLTPGMSVIGEAGGTMQLVATAPGNSTVTAYWGSNSCRLIHENDTYRGSMPLHEEPASSPILLVSKKTGMLQVTIAPTTVTVPEKTASVRAYTFSDTNTAHTAVLILDAPCNAQVSLENGKVTLSLQPCQLAPLLEDPLFTQQQVSKNGTQCTYTFHAPDTVLNLRTEWSGTRLRLIFELK